MALREVSSRRPIDSSLAYIYNSFARSQISIALLGLTLATLGSCDLDHPRFVIGSYPFDSLMHGSEHIASFKKLPTEDKAPRKKPLPPFYSLPEEPKIKEILLKSGAPYCQEITPKESRAGSGVEDKRTSCYRCKDPKNGSSYEHCSYSSQPPSDSLGAGSHPAETSRKAREDSAEKLPEAYRFSEDYFQPEASHELPAEYEKKVDNCERVVKDSMVCMICKEPKTSGKYEQCSYVAQPNEKAYAYSKSSSFGGAKPRDEAREQPEESRKRDKQDSEEEQDEDEHSYRYPSYKDYKPSSYGSYEADEEQAAKPNCETVQKDGQSCTVCANPKTGGKSEQCAYSHEPKDKVYKYSKSKSFGYPESASESSRKAEGAESEEEEEGEPSTLDYIRSESEKISKQVKGQGDCRRVKRDDELCTICKDPKTGGENEQCNYSYEPEDKLFAYSKSKSFGSPGKSSSEDEYAGSSEERPEESFVSPSLVYPTGTSALDYIPKSSRAQVASSSRPAPK
ncbi:hypothetical protein TSAR_000554 [Trichomalopsis sarcophagae]|uniref:Uncharacterized protein n=1 Tax=Trichomalopsis sarcophagae TaxID=543379 RepID=A0A232EHU6_9HYME|nr:hypothetical protein TSAR_000554 [Trichomalopsis sarcophagae]